MNWIALDAQGYAVAKYLLAILWQSSLLFAGVGVIALLLRRHAPRTRRALWLTALLVAPTLPLLSTLAKPSGLPQQEVAAFPTYTPPVTMSVPVVRPPVPMVAAPQHPVTASPVPAPHPLDYPWALALMAYAIGCAGFLSWTLLGHFRIWQWIQSGQVASEAHLVDAFREAATRLKLRRQVRVVMTDHVCAPVTVGLFRATVLLPKDFMNTLTDDDLVAVAIHETAHIRQHDPLFLTVASLVRGLLFFHPLVWVACRALAVLAEHVADDAVLEATGQPLPYAKLLTALAERLPRRTPSVEGAAGLILCKSAFLRRVEAILGDRSRIRRITRWTLAASLAGCLAVIGVVLAVPLTQRETPDLQRDWRAGEVVSGLQVSISLTKTKFGYMEPIHIRSRIQNVSKEPKTIIWQKPPTSPMIFEVVKPDDMKHYFEDLSMKERLLSPNSLPEIRVLQPGSLYETFADLRQVLNIDPHKTDGSFELRTLYSPRNASTMSYRLKKDSFQVPEGVFMELVASPTLSFTLTDDLTWLKDQLASGNLDAAKKLVEPLGKDYVLAELKKLYSTKSLLDKLPLVDCMAQLGNTSHIKDILDAYDSGELLPPGSIYEECKVWIFLLKWGANREQKHLVHFLQENLGHVYNTDNTTFSVDPFLVALVEGRDEMGNEFSLDKGAAPLMAMVLDVQKAKEHRNIKDAAGVEHDVTVRWCDEAAMMLQKILQRDWGFTCDKPVKERDAIITRMRTEFADLVRMLSSEDPKTDIKNSDQGNCIKKVQANVLEGPILLDQDQMLYIEMKDNNSLSATPRLRFTQEKDTVTGVLVLAYPSWPRIRWRAQLELLDQEGKTLSSEIKAIDNDGDLFRSGRIGYRFENESKHPFSFPENLMDKARRFRFSMESVWTEVEHPFNIDEDIKVDLSLDAPEYSSTLYVNKIQVPHADKDYTATIPIRFLSWPKATWQLSVILSDKDGKEVGKGVKRIENIGSIETVPEMERLDDPLPIVGNHDAIEHAKNVTIRIEKIDATTKPEISSPDSATEINTPQTEAVPNGNKVDKILQDYLNMPASTDTSSREERKKALQQLTSSGEEAVRSIESALPKVKEARQRAELAEALGAYIQTKESASLLVTLLKDPDANVRNMAIGGLAGMARCVDRYGNKRIQNDPERPPKVEGLVPQLIGAFNDPVPTNRIRVLYALANTRDLNILTTLHQGLSDPDIDVRLYAACFLTEYADPCSLPAIERLTLSRSSRFKPDMEEMITASITRIKGQFAWKPPMIPCLFSITNSPAKVTFLNGWMEKLSAQDKTDPPINTQAVTGASMIPVQSKQDAVKRIYDNVIEGPFELNRVFALPLEISEKSNVPHAPTPAISEAPVLEFTNDNEEVHGTVQVKYNSWPQTRWRAHLELLDQDGKSIDNAMKTFESSGKIYQAGSFISMENEQAELLFSFPASLMDAARRFRFSMESVYAEMSETFLFDEDTTLTLNLNALEYSNVINVNTFRVIRRENGYALTFHTKYSSWPKTTWRLSSILTDAENKEVGKAQSLTIENNGTIAGGPLNCEANNSVSIIGDHDAIERAKSITIRLEKGETDSQSTAADPTQAVDLKGKPPIGDLIKTLDSDQQHLREPALNALKEMGPAAQEAIPALIKALSAYPDQSSCHSIASQTLSRIGVTAIPALEQAAASDDVLLRIWANAALLSNPKTDPARWQCLSEALQSKDKITYQEALNAVQMLGPKAASLVPQVTNILRIPDHNREDTMNALAALARIGAAASPAFPEVIKWLDAADPLVRSVALRAVTAMEGTDRKTAIPKLVLTLEANDTSDPFVALQQRDIREKAAQALGSMGPDAREALPNLIKVLDDPDEFVRAAVVEALGKIEPANPSVLPRLIKAMRDPSFRVQYTANRILVELGPVNIEIIQGFIQAIRENGEIFNNNGMISGPSDSILFVAEEFIWRLKPEHRYAVPDFTALAEDPNPGVQRLAKIALANISKTP